MNTLNYTQCLDYLYDLKAFHLVGAEAYKPGLDTTKALMQSLDNPQDKYPTIHIAGTNGKGSTSHLIAAALQQAGLRVGLFTSPHLIDFRERIRINGQMITKETVTQFINENQVLLSTLQPSFFEATTALALSYFAQQEVDIAVIETGLGGRLDATNILSPLLSVITNIGLDHEEYLGTTIAAIASEKAGIIKPLTPVVIGETDAESAPVFIQKADKLNSPIVFADQQEKYDCECQLEGKYQKKNIQTARCALSIYNDICAEHSLPSLSEDNLREAFLHVADLTGLRGRWEILQASPLIICDTGHNSHGLSYVSEQLEELINSKGPDTHLNILFGMVDDKDVDKVFAMLPKNGRYFLTEAATKRAISAKELKRLAAEQHLKAEAFANVAVALQAALRETQESDILFIGGSNYIVGEALQLLEKGS